MQLKAIDRNQVRVGAMSGALATLVFAVMLMTASSASAAFSVSAFSTSSTSSLAGAHPDLTTDLTFSTTSPEPPSVLPDGNVRDLTVNLPAGLVGNPQAVPQCAQSDFANNACQAAAQIGSVDLELLTNGFAFSVTLPVFNMQPRNQNQTGEVAFSLEGLVTVHMPISVRTDGDYGLTATVLGVSRIFGIARVALTLWGVPGDPSHDALRTDMLFNPMGPSQIGRVPFLTNPTRCDGPLSFTMSADSYQSPGTSVHASSSLPQLTGCVVAPFDPSFTMQPQSTRAGSPSGFEAVLSVPQNANPDGQASADLRDATVSLPAGVSISPSSADGLAGCDDASLNLASTGAAACPDASKIGEMELDVPLLPAPVRGGIYLRQPLPGDLFRIVLVADDFGVHLKIPGDVQADPLTGQLKARFADSPQVPFSKLVLDFDGGPRAPLRTPRECGTYTTHARLTPWSSETPAESESSFTIDQGCDQAAKFEPSLDAGLTNPVAATSSAFTMTLSRPGGQEDLESIDLALPSGLLARVGSVPLCPEAQAAAGTCSVASQIGSATIAAGSGANPLYVPQAGKSPTAVYLAGPYKGAPFSLAIVVPAQAGPYDLGTVVVRTALFVDVHDAHVTVKSDPIPTILQGIPLDIQKLNVTIDRPGFMLSPTSCDPMRIGGQLTSREGAAASVASRFQVGGCSELGFAPKLSATTAGAARPNGRGASLHVRLLAKGGLTSPGRVSGEANIKRVEVQLPKSLPARLTTLQKSCTQAQFVANPAGCPEDSFVGTATAVTPVLPVPLAGPAILVSHGGASLPDVVIVLQGYGVTLELVGNTKITKGITHSRFETVPDAPVTSFELNLPQSPHSVLSSGSFAGLCGQKLVMPTFMEAQNGIKFHQSTRIAVTGCPKHKARKAARHNSKARRREGKR